MRNREQLIVALARVGVDVATFLPDAEQLVCFGSWAMGFEREESDIDLLAVGGAERRRRLQIDRVDLVSISNSYKESDRWLGSELASHINKYGVWLRGLDDWGERCQIADHAIAFKERSIADRFDGLESHYDLYTKKIRRKHGMKARRDLQRLEYLENNSSIPCSPVLDLEWRAMQDSPDGKSSLKAIWNGRESGQRSEKIWELVMDS